MGVFERFYVVFGILLISLLLKWIVPRIIIPIKIQRWCISLFGQSAELPSFGSMLRSLGWDFCNSALGLVVIATILENSNFNQIRVACGNYGSIFVVSCFFILVILFSCAIDLKYIFLETAERTRRYQKSFGFVLWMLGLLILLYACWFITEG